MLVHGNEPLRIFRELGKLGEISVSADVSELPKLGDINPRVCSIRWTIILKGELAEDQVKEVFAWVEDEATISLAPMSGAAAAPAAAPAPAAPAAEKPAPSAPCQLWPMPSTTP